MKETTTNLKFHFQDRIAIHKKPLSLMRYSDIQTFGILASTIDEIITHLGPISPVLWMIFSFCGIWK